MAGRDARQCGWREWQALRALEAEAQPCAKIGHFYFALTTIDPPCVMAVDILCRRCGSRLGHGWFPTDPLIVLACNTGQFVEIRDQSTGLSSRGLHD